MPADLRNIDREGPTDPPKQVEAPKPADLEGLARRISLPPPSTPTLYFEYKKGDRVIQSGRLHGVAAVAALRALEGALDR